MNRLALSAVAALAITIGGQTAFAADLGYKAPVAPLAAPSWTGFYLGAHAGWGWASNDSATQALTAIGTAPLSFNLDNDSPIVGLQAGYNYQFSNWLVGVEGDVSGTRFSNPQTGTLFIGAALPEGTATINEDIRWLASVRGRAGYVWGPGLFYVTGGAAWADVKYSASTSATPIPITTFPASFTSTSSGLVVGGGYEWMLTGNWTLRGEFLHYWFDKAPSASVTPFAGVTATYTWSRFDINVARLGLSYKFN